MRTHNYFSSISIANQRQNGCISPGSSASVPGEGSTSSSAVAGGGGWEAQGGGRCKYCQLKSGQSITFDFQFPEFFKNSFLKFSHILHPDQSFPSLPSSPTDNFPTLPRSLFLQKRAGLPEISTEHSITSFSKTRHKPSYQPSSDPNGSVTVLSVSLGPRSFQNAVSTYPRKYRYVSMVCKTNIWRSK